MAADRPKAYRLTDGQGFFTGWYTDDGIVDYLVAVSAHEEALMLEESDDDPDRTRPDTTATTG